MLIAGVSASNVKLPVVQPPETLLVLALTLVTCKNMRPSASCGEGEGEGAAELCRQQHAEVFSRTLQDRQCMSGLGLVKQKDVDVVTSQEADPYAHRQWPGPEASNFLTRMNLKLCRLLRIRKLQGKAICQTCAY